MDWLLRLDARPDDKGLRRDVDEWLGRCDANAAAFRDMKRVWSGLDRLASAEAAAAAPTVGQPSIPPQAARSLRPRRLRLYAAGAVAAVAACVAIVAFPTLQMRLSADAITNVAERRSLSLGDGSVAMLDARSAVAVNYSSGLREISLLSGNAFFQVVPSADRPFVVRAGGVAVTVVGTAFAVGTTPTQVSVAVESGTVRVASHPGASAVLGAGQGLTVDRASGHETRIAVLPEDVGAWRAGRLVVHDVPLGAVVEQLGRYHNGFIVFQDRRIENELVSGVFDLARPVEALAAALDSQGGRVRSLTPYLLLVTGP